MSTLFALLVHSFNYIALVKPKYSSEDVYAMIEEIQDKVYAQHPQIMNRGEDALLAGTKMYISEIVRRHNADKVLIGPEDVIVNDNSNPSLNELEGKVKEDKINEEIV